MRKSAQVAPVACCLYLTLPLAGLANKPPIRPIIEERLRDVRVTEAVLKNWAKEPREDKTAKLRQSLERQLADFEQKEAALEKRVSFAFDMAAEGGPGAAEARRLIAKAEQERMTLEAQRAALTQKLAQLPVARANAYTVRDLQWDAEQFPNFRMGAEGIIEADIREPFAKWVRAIGAPELERYQPPKKGKARLRLHWCFLDTVKKQPEAAPEVPEVDLTSVA